MTQSLKDLLRRDIIAFESSTMATSLHIRVYKAKKELLKLLVMPIEWKDTDLLPNEYYKKR